MLEIFLLLLIFFIGTYDFKVSSNKERIDENVQSYKNEIKQIADIHLKEKEAFLEENQDNSFMIITQRYVPYPDIHYADTDDETKPLISTYENEVKKAEKEFSDEVNLSIKNGWKCQGNIYESNSKICQAMVKE